MPLYRNATSGGSNLVAVLPLQEVCPGVLALNCSTDGKRGGCNYNGFCNPATGVCACMPGFGGATCSTLLPVVRSPAVVCPVGPCVRAKGLRACAHLNGLPVCAASSADALARDAMVGRALEEHFWTGGPGCMADMSAFLCAHSLPVCTQDSTVWPRCAWMCAPPPTPPVGWPPLGIRGLWFHGNHLPRRSVFSHGVRPHLHPRPARRQPPHRHWLLCAGGQR